MNNIPAGQNSSKLTKPTKDNIKQLLEAAQTVNFLLTQKF